MMMEANVKVLIIHNRYRERGGEDTVVDQELDLLKDQFNVRSLIFENKSGLSGGIQFLLSLYNVFAAARIRRVIKEFKPDIVHVHNWHYAAGPVVFRIVKKMQLPVVHTLHNYRILCPSAILIHRNIIFTTSLDENFPWTAVKKKVYRNSRLQTYWLGFIIWFHQKIGTWKRIDRYICLTEFAKDLFSNSKKGITKSQLVVKHNFIDQECFSEDDRQNHFLFVGRLSDEKGIKTLLEASKKGIFKVKIAGDGPLMKLVVNEQVSNPNVNYLGVLNRQDVINEMKKAQALIFPSNWFEGMPMTIIESLSTQTPVIASNLGAMSSMIKNEFNGLLFEQNNSDSLCDMVKSWNELSEDSKNRIRENCRKDFNQKYSGDSNLKKFKEIYQSMLNE